MTDGQQAATEFAREINAMTSRIRKEDYQDLETRIDTLVSDDLKPLIRQYAEACKSANVPMRQTIKNLAAVFGVVG